MLSRRLMLTVPNKYISDVDARTMHKYPQVCIEIPCGNNAEYLQLCIVTGRWFAASKYLQVCTATSYAGSGVLPRVAEAVRISAVSVIEWETGPWTGATIVSNVVHACEQFPQRWISLIHATRIAAHCRATRPFTTRSPPLRKIALIFLMDYCRVISTFPSNFRTRESSTASVPVARTRIIINVPRGANFRDNWPFSFSIDVNENSTNVFTFIN